MAVASALYSIRYMEHYPDYGLRGYYLCYPLFILGMAGLVTVDDLAIGFTLSWQVMTIASYFLIRFEHRKPENVRNAGKYLVLMELAWLLVVGGAFFVRGYRSASRWPRRPPRSPGPEACRSSGSSRSSSPGSG